MYMEEPNLKEKSQTKAPTLEELIKREWEMIEDLQKMLKDTELSVTEKTRVATVYAYHINILRRMVAKKNQDENSLFEEQNLGDFIRGVEPRIARRFRRDFNSWQRTTMSRR
jgi:hypothetical protein